MKQLPLTVTAALLLSLTLPASAQVDPPAAMPDDRSGRACPRLDGDMAPGTTGRPGDCLSNEQRMARHQEMMEMRQRMWDQGPGPGGMMRGPRSGMWPGGMRGRPGRGLSDEEWAARREEMMEMRQRMRDQGMGPGSMMWGPRSRMWDDDMMERRRQMMEMRREMMDRGMCPYGMPWGRMAEPGATVDTGNAPANPPGTDGGEEKTAP
jgi:hypothetical protein